MNHLINVPNSNLYISLKGTAFFYLSNRFVGVRKIKNYVSYIDSNHKIQMVNIPLFLKQVQKEILDIDLYES